MLVLWLALVPPLAANSKLVRNILPELDQKTKAKLLWLDKYGTPIRVGQPGQRLTRVACRKGSYDLIRHDWGLERTHRNEELIPCPAFFDQP